VLILLQWKLLVNFSGGVIILHGVTMGHLLLPFYLIDEGAAGILKQCRRVVLDFQLGTLHHHHHHG